MTIRIFWKFYSIIDKISLETSYGGETGEKKIEFWLLGHPVYPLNEIYS